MSKKKTVSLVLSSGGARGLAHVGVIEELESRGYMIAEIAGCSAGALVGGMYAAGKLPEFKDWICNLDRVDVFSLMDFTFSSRGFIKGEKVYNALKKVVKDCQIEDLSIPFSCNAVDYRRGQEVIFREGSLYAAIRASGSIPSVFQPARHHRHEFIDGGVLNPVPISLISNHENRLLAVVEVNGPESLYIEPPKKDEKGRRFMSIPSWLKDYQLKMRHYFPEEIKEEKSTSLSSINLLTRSFDLLQDRFCELLIEKYPVDMMVRVSRKQAGTLEFHRAGEMIEIGRQKAKEALDALENGDT
ncbi:MAG: patatin-like phospholipase family protein [Algoriphagus sp.]|jgi:NTE family protein|uniref:patatin-like phospholipase family protein n=1 Tax=Algoriphagus sp. TaxID=1872435 RepID=UPI00273178CD|nr:patatin-like phospholipase family protein [Algoriphagus sp.]MDP2042894.1 patatin-like phospholipase family protein [Algoriphagus sp.]MDP3200586.1 patatin-like phospholipase family protein [Algoriphagus sp.]MDP3471149.1 patatin-like phospholipase family protein [Algoriphagus sp.]